MRENKFLKKLGKTQKLNNSFLVIGLDPQEDKLPASIRYKKDNFFYFNKKIIDFTFDLVCAYKFNLGFYLANGSAGLDFLKKTIFYIKKKYSYIPVILDGKCADIDNTNLAYKKFFFNWLKADAITLNPYLGQSALLPFLTLKDKFFFILTRTSNLGSQEFQDLKIKKESLYMYVARRVNFVWNKRGNCGLVVGATFPNELASIRKVANDILILVPGIGAQGGDLKKTIKAGIKKRNSKPNLIYNVSRGIIYASEKKNFFYYCRQEAKRIKDEINSYLNLK